MQQYWTRFENWFTQNAPEMLNLLPPGASQSDIELLEATIGQKLPEDFVQFYKIHNGQEEGDDRLAFIEGEFLLPVKGIIDDWKLIKEVAEQFMEDPETPIPAFYLDDGIKADCYNPGFIPFTYDGSGNNICIDLNPAPDGSFGQVVRIWHDTLHRELIADSFEDYIDFYLAAMERGKYIFVKERGIVDKESYEDDLSN